MHAQRWEISFSTIKNNITVLRLLLAAIIVYSHGFLLASRTALQQDLEPSLSIPGGRIILGEIAVDAFFILSGFFITASFENKKSLKAFVRGRILRIYPALLFAWVIYTLLVPVIALGTATPTLTFPILLQNMAKAILLWEPSCVGIFSQNPLPSAINGSLWTLRYEFGLYGLTILLGCLGILSKRIVPLTLLLGALLLMFLQEAGICPLISHKIIQVSYWVIGKPDQWIRFTAFYLCGLVFYLYRNKIPYSPKLFVLSLSSLIYATLLSYRLFTILFPLFGTYILLFIAFAPIRNINWVNRLGNLSYWVYLYAFPIEQLLIQFSQNTLIPPLLFLITMAIILMASLSNVYVFTPLFFKTLISTFAPARGKKHLA